MADNRQEPINGQPQNQIIQPRLFGDCYKHSYGNDLDVRPIAAEAYTIPPTLITLVQNGATFNGLDNEDPYEHVKAFIFLSNTCKIAGIPQDEIRRMLFPFSLRGQAMAWYSTHGGYSKNTFEELIQEFTTKYFPPTKMEKIRQEIHQFQQKDSESFKEAWERFQELLKKCPNRLIEREYEMQLFYNGLSIENKNIVNASAGGTITEKTYEEVKELFNRIAKNHNIAPMVRGYSTTSKQGAILELDPSSGLAAQIALLTTQISTFLKTQQGVPTIKCGLCQEAHHTDQCPQLADVNAIRNFQRNQNSSWQPQQQGSSSWNSNQNQWSTNQNNSSWNQPTRQWGQQGTPHQQWQNQEENQQWQSNNDFRRAPPGFNQMAPSVPQIEYPTKPQIEYRPQNQGNSTFQELKRMYEEQQKEMTLFKTHLKNVETQVGQIAQASNTRQQGGLPSDTIISSRGKEQCNAVSLRSGKQLKAYDDQQQNKVDEDEEDVEEVYSDPEPSSVLEKKIGTLTTETADSSRNQSPPNKQDRQEDCQEQKLSDKLESTEKVKNSKVKEFEKSSPNKDSKGNSSENSVEYRPLPPYPLRPKKAKKPVDKEYKQFLDMMKSVSLSITAYELFTGTPKFAKFFKQMLSQKDANFEDELVEVSARCSELLKKDFIMPRKVKDPGSCNIKCEFSTEESFNALCDLGSGVSLMPRYIAEKLDLSSKMKYTPVKLQLADRSIVRPQGIVEDVCVKVGNFVLPCDFMIMDVEIDKATPLIIGRPFLATGDAWIGVKDKIVVLQVNGERLVLNLDRAMQYPAEPIPEKEVDPIDSCVNEIVQVLYSEPSLLDEDFNQFKGEESFEDHNFTHLFKT